MSRNAPVEPPPMPNAPGWLHASLQAARVEAARVPAWARRVMAAREAGVWGSTDNQPETLRWAKR